MTEKEMEDLLWNYPEKLLNEQLTQLKRQAGSNVGRADLIFTDRLGRVVIVELKRGKLQRGAISQLLDYFGMMKKEFPDKPVELVVVANQIPEERRLACEQYNIEPREIPEKKFRDVAEEMGYEIASEGSANWDVDSSRSRGTGSNLTINRGIRLVAPLGLTAGRPRRPSVFRGSIGGASSAKVDRAWYHWVDPSRGSCFLAFVNARGSCSIRVFEAETGVLLDKRYESGDFQSAFRKYLTEGTPLTVSHQPNLERAGKEGLPEDILNELRRQVPNLAQALEEQRRHELGGAARAASPFDGMKPKGTSKVERAWYHWRDPAGRGYFLAFVNARGSCSIRAFDVQTGAPLEKRYEGGDFQVVFAKYLAEGTPLTVSRQPNLEQASSEGLPNHVLEELRDQLSESHGGAEQKISPDAKDHNASGQSQKVRVEQFGGGKGIGTSETSALIQQLSKIDSSLSKVCQEALETAGKDPRAALVVFRRSLEGIVAYLLRANNVTIDSSLGLSDKIRRLKDLKYVTPATITHMHTLRTLGNEAAHGGAISMEDAQIAGTALLAVLKALFPPGR